MSSSDPSPGDGAGRDPGGPPGALTLAGAAWVSVLIGLGQILATGSALGVAVCAGIAVTIGLAGLHHAWRHRLSAAAVSAVLVVTAGALSLGASAHHLVAAGAPASAADASVAGAVGTPTGDVLHQGRLSLDEGLCADLDTREPDWGATTAYSYSSYSSCKNLDGDLNHHGEALIANADLTLALVTGASAPTSSDTCRSQTARDRSIDSEDVVAGARLCVRTSSGNLSLLRVRSVSGNNPGRLGEVAFDVITWRG